MDQFRMFKTLYGSLNTKDTTYYGKDNKGRKYFLFRPFVNPSFKFFVPYQGKYQGKIILGINKLDKSKKNKKYYGSVARIIGNYKNQYLPILRLAQTDQKIKFNPIKKEIDNLKFKVEKDDSYIFSIDPECSLDVDDAISFKNNLISVYLACPLAHLSYEDTLLRQHQMISTLYGDKIMHLWGDEITKKSSLLQDEERIAFKITFDYFLEEIKEIKFVNITNKFQTSYNQANQIISKKNDHVIYHLSEYLKINQSTKLIEKIMVKTNYLLAKYFIDKELPFISRNFEYEEQKIVSDPEINQIFNLHQANRAEYDYKNYQGHKLLNLPCYSHFTSPIRRWVDTYHQLVLYYHLQVKNYYMPKFQKPKISRINHLDKLVKRYYYLNRLDEIDLTKLYIGKLYDIRGNKMEVYLPELKFFLKGNLYHPKEDFQYEVLKEENIWKVIDKIENTEKVFNLGQDIKVKVICRDKITGYYQIKFF